MKRILAILLCLMMTLPTVSMAEENVPTIHLFGVEQDVPADNVLTPVIEEALNIKIETTATYDDESPLIARIAGGDVPDIFRVTTINHLKDYYNQEVLLDLTPYMDRMPNIQKMFTESDWARVTFDGHIYAIPRRAEKNYYAWYNRYDWMEKLGVESPKTFDELFDICAKMKDADLDGNGVSDTYPINGMLGHQANAFDGFYSAYNVTWPETVIIRDGQAILSAMAPEFKLALQEIRRFVDAGFVDPEVVSNTLETRREKMATGKSGFVFGGWSFFSKPNYKAEIQAIDANANWGPMKTSIETAYGSSGAIRSACGYSAVYAINADLVDKPEVLDAVLRFFDYIASEEGDTLLSFGIKGVHYDVDENGTIIKLPEMDTLTYAYNLQITGRQDMLYCMTKFADCADYIKFCANDVPVVYYYSDYIEPPEDYNLTDLNSYISQQIAAFIFGTRSMDEYDKFIQELYDSFDLKSYLDAGTAQLTDLGFIK